MIGSTLFKQQIEVSDWLESDVKTGNGCGADASGNSLSGMKKFL